MSRLKDAARHELLHGIGANLATKSSEHHLYLVQLKADAQGNGSANLYPSDTGLTKMVPVTDKQLRGMALGPAVLGSVTDLKHLLTSKRLIGTQMSEQDIHLFKVHGGDPECLTPEDVDVLVRCFIVSRSAGFEAAVDAVADALIDGPLELPLASLVGSEARKRALLDTQKTAHWLLGMGTPVAPDWLQASVERGMLEVAHG